MASIKNRILTLNGGSSSIKFALFALGNPPKRELHGQISRIGQTNTSLLVADESDAGVISTNTSRVMVQVIPTDEEQMIARTVWHLLTNNKE